MGFAVIGRIELFDYWIFNLFSFNWKIAVRRDRRRRRRHRAGRQ